jgi:CPA2 family monovalent cation:H+ antiporter-2
MEYTLLYVIVALGISIVINIFLKRVGVSQIVGYIATGAIIVYTLDLKYLSESETLGIVAEFGIVFLMFTIGLEISLAKMNSMKNIIFTNGILQVGLSATIFYLVCYYIFELAPIPSTIIALAFSLSSTAIVLSYLKSTKEIYAPYGQRVTGILIFQDIAVIPILILIGILTNEGGESIETILYHTLMSAVIVLALFFVVGKKVISWLLHFSASSELDELFMGSVLFVVIGASLLAHYMGFTYSLGAFVAGMLIAETKYHHKVESDIAPFKDILLGVFFVVVGMKINLEMFVDNIVLIVAVFLLTLFLKTVIIFGVVRLSSINSVSLKTGVAISQVGEFSFVIFALATMSGLIDNKLSELLVLIVILSMVVTPFLIPKTKQIADFFIKDKSTIPEVVDMAKRKDHVVVCGYGVVGKFVEQNLELYGVDYIIIDNNPKHVQRALDNGLEAYLGDMSKRSIIEALHVENAAAVIVTLDNTQKKRLICEAILEQTKYVNLVVKIVSAEEREALKDLDINVIVDGKVEVARVLVERMMTCQLKYS